MGICAFSLDLETLKLIAFAMEDINSPSLFDSKTKLIAKSDDQGDSLIPLPTWTSKDGFTAMEGFVQQLKNPQLRENLRAILQSGRGVFKEFKAELRQHPLFEKQWFQYKDTELRRRITKWHTEIHEELGLEAIAHLEPHEATDEILIDLELRDLGASQLESVMTIANDLVADATTSSMSLSFIFDRLIRKAGLSLYEAKTCVSGPDDSCGLAALFYDPEIPSLGLVFLFVAESFRGLGIGSLLLSKLMPTIKKSPFVEILYIDEAEGSFVFERLSLHFRADVSMKNFSLKSLATKN